jgi:hypothetical protein
LSTLTIKSPLTTDFFCTAIDLRHTVVSLLPAAAWVSSITTLDFFRLPQPRTSFATAISSTHLRSLLQNALLLLQALSSRAYPQEQDGAPLGCRVSHQGAAEGCRCGLALHKALEGAPSALQRDPEPTSCVQPSGDRTNLQGQQRVRLQDGPL